MNYLHRLLNTTFVACVAATAIPSPPCPAAPPEGRPVQADAAGALVLPGRAATVRGNAIRIDHTGQIADIRTDCTAEWTLVVPKAGQYEIEVEQSATFAGEYELTMGGKRVAADVTVTGDWSKYERAYVGSVQLAEGPTTLTLRAIRVGSSLMNLREVRLLPTLKPRPAPLRAAKADAPGRPPAGRPGQPPDRQPRPDAAAGPLLVKPRLVLQHPSAVHAAAFGTGGKTIVTAADGGVTKVWDTAGAEVAAPKLAGRESARVLALAPDQRTLAAAGEFDAIKLLNPATGAEVASWPAQGGSLYGVTAVAWSADGRRLATAAGKKVVVWDVAKRAAASIPAVPGNANSVKGLAFAPDGSQLTAIMSGEDDAHRQVTYVAAFDPASGKLGRVLTFPSVGSMWIRYVGPKTLAMRYGDGTGLLDVPSGKVCDELYAGRGLPCAAVSADGRLLAVGGVAPNGRSSADVWDVAAGTCLATLTGHTDDLTSVAFSPDGKLIVTASADKTARVYDTPPPAATGPDLKAVAARLSGTWRATPEVNDRLIGSLMKRKGVPPDKLDEAVGKMRQAMAGLSLTYTFGADGSVAVAVAGGGNTQVDKGRWEVVRARDTVIRVRLTSPTADADLLTVHMAPGAAERFEMAIPDTPVRQPVMFTRAK